MISFKRIIVLFAALLFTIGLSSCFFNSNNHGNNEQEQEQEQEEKEDEETDEEQEQEEKEDEETDEEEEQEEEKEEEEQLYKPETILSLYEIENTVGNVNKVFTSSGIEARYCTGQEIDNFCNFGSVRFYGELVEYNSISEKILNYVESLESNNALMHQNYPRMEYDESKKYVELSVYTSTETGNIVAAELRIFFGNFMQTYKTEMWYAKSVMFSPDMKIDMHNNKNIETGEYAHYWGTKQNTDTNVKVIHTAETTNYPSLLNDLGSLNKVYGNYYDDGSVASIKYTDGRLSFVSYYAEYTSLNPAFKSQLDKLKLDGLTQSGYNVNEDESKYYVEYVEYTALVETEKDSIGLRVVDAAVKNEMNKKQKWSWYAKCMGLSTYYLKEGYTILDLVLNYDNYSQFMDYSKDYVNQDNQNDNNNNQNNKPYVDPNYYQRDAEEITEYPFFIDSFGIVSKVYKDISYYGKCTDYEYEDGSCKVTYYCVEYSSLNEKFASYMNNLDSQRLVPWYSNFDVDSSKFYIIFTYYFYKDNPNWTYIDVEYIDYGKKNNGESDYYRSYRNVYQRNLTDTYSAVDYIYDYYVKSVEVSVYPSYINDFGLVSKVYTRLNIEQNLKFTTWGSGVKVCSYFAEYNSFNDEFEALYQNMDSITGSGWTNYGNTFDENKRYIEFIEEYDSNTNILSTYNTRIFNSEEYQKCRTSPSWIPYARSENISAKLLSNSFTLYECLVGKLTNDTNVQVTISFAETNDIDINLSSNSNSNGINLWIQNENFSNATYRWLIDGVEKPNSNRYGCFFNIEAYNPGFHQILLIVTVDGCIYTAQADIEITK